MASVCVTTNPPSSIDYSLLDGRVRSFTLRGVKLYDEQDGTRADGWEGVLSKFVQEQGLDADVGEFSARAFVYWMRAKGI